MDILKIKNWKNSYENFIKFVYKIVNIKKRIYLTNKYKSFSKIRYHVLNDDRTPQFRPTIYFYQSTEWLSHTSSFRYFRRRIRRRPVPLSLTCRVRCS